MSGPLYIVSAPSGAGKTTLVAALLSADPMVQKSVSYTTRAPRPGEVNGHHYHAVAIFVLLPSISALEHRLRGRAQDSAELTVTQVSMELKLLIEQMCEQIQNIE